MTAWLDQHLVNICKMSGIDPLTLPSSIKPFEVRCMIASKIIRQSMRDPLFYNELRGMKAEYLHDKGWSISRFFKSEYTIPQSAYLVLPAELRKDKKALKKWLKDNHPYLIFSTI